RETAGNAPADNIRDIAVYTAYLLPVMPPRAVVMVDPIYSKRRVAFMRLRFSEQWRRRSPGAFYLAERLGE
ncbi:hypothetical protein EJ658_16055, partial [Salmonella enterica]|nr:hypothetical protein [Salmonella enterica]EAR5208752.1 hypothetical protein [Salmonella enterica]EBM5794606.1 hypothetical protein [Salmonella enterica]